MQTVHNICVHKHSQRATSTSEIATIRNATTNIRHNAAHAHLIFSPTPIHERGDCNTLAAFTNSNHAGTAMTIHKFWSSQTTTRTTQSHATTNETAQCTNTLAKTPSQTLVRGAGRRVPSASPCPAGKVCAAGPGAGHRVLPASSRPTGRVCSGRRGDRISPPAGRYTLSHIVWKERTYKPRESYCHRSRRM